MLRRLTTPRRGLLLTGVRPLTSAALPDQVQFNVGEASPTLKGNVTVG